MKKFSSEAIVVCCPNCGQRNRVSDPFKENRIWKCASCSKELLHARSRPGDRLLSRCIDQLKNAVEDLGSLKSGIFAGKKIIEIETQLTSVRSKVDAWKEHLEFFAEPQERELAKRYHSKDLLEIDLLEETIRQQIESKRWLQKFFSSSETAKSVLRGFSDLIAITSSVLTIIGIPNGLLDVSRQLGAYRLEFHKS